MQVLYIVLESYKNALMYMFLTSISFLLIDFYVNNWPLWEMLDVTLSDKRLVKTDLKTESSKIILEM